MCTACHTRAAAASARAATDVVFIRRHEIWPLSPGTGAKGHSKRVGREGLEAVPGAVGSVGGLCQASLMPRRAREGFGDGSDQPGTSVALQAAPSASAAGSAGGADEASVGVGERQSRAGKRVSRAPTKYADAAESSTRRRPRAEEPAEPAAEAADSGLAARPTKKRSRKQQGGAAAEPPATSEAQRPGATERAAQKEVRVGLSARSWLSTGLWPVDRDRGVRVSWARALRRRRAEQQLRAGRGIGRRRRDTIERAGVRR